MKTVKKILDKLLGRVCVVVAFCVVSVAPLYAAGNGCDDENNDAISATLALCSTHVYNIGETTNPSGPNKDLMKEVVAMKTTVIAQQLYKQYEQMDSMLRRLKTQLEKAVLTTKLQAAGASTSSSSSSSGGDAYQSEDRNIHMAGVKNCMNLYHDSEILKCYEDNLNSIITQSSNGVNVTTELKKQIVQDFCALDDIAIGESKKDSCIGKNTLKDGKIQISEYCTGTSKAQTLGKKDFQEMIDKMRFCLQEKYRAYNNSQKQQKNRD